jgi:transcriptional regulator with XRE-family HTH domain
MRDYRKRSGLTMKRLGELVGASEASISQYETGRVEPDIDLMTKIADVLGVSVDNLIGHSSDIENMEPKTKEARILAHGIDKLPQEQREQALNVMKAMFSKYAPFFEEMEDK